ncbi:WD40/YVTN/BNR-like repeat-containing protein [Noviherbaspirillum sp. ST9]|uniref:WD40/YVTN/BNR-like repeat-containing protein n=1 Tax=Noviherbaspirillum sp. ST9 TaxID=3401606 RepID=UPI003B588789
MTHSAASSSRNTLIPPRIRWAIAAGCAGILAAGMLWTRDGASAAANKTPPELIPTASAGGQPFDLLETPAPQSPRAAAQLMNALARAGSRLVAAGARGTIIYSDDEGTSWKQASVPVSVMITGLAFPTESKGWAVGHDGAILHTADSGQTWVRQFDGVAAGKLMLAHAEKRVEQLRKKVDGQKAPSGELADALEAAEDALAGIESASRFGPSRPLLGTWFKDENEGYAVGSFGMAFSTQDGGKTWTLMSDRFPDAGERHYYTITSPMHGVILIAGEEGTILRSADGGKTWREQPSLTKGSIYGLLTSRHEGKTRVLAFGFGGVLFRSEDFGATWSQIELDTKSALYGGAALDGGSVLVAGNNGALVSSEDGGASFAFTRTAGGRPLTSVARLKTGVLLAGWGGVIQQGVER